MDIRRFRDGDAAGVSALIATTLRTTNIRDYSSEYIEALIRTLPPEAIVERAKWMHLYVALDGERIIGSGGIGPYWGSADVSSLFTIFVSPEFQGRGVGRRIVEVLEADEFALRAKRIEVPASITAVPFYQKLGYDYKPGAPRTPDAEGLLRLEKLL